MLNNHDQKNNGTIYDVRVAQTKNKTHEKLNRKHNNQLQRIRFDTA